MYVSYVMSVCVYFMYYYVFSFAYAENVIKKFYPTPIVHILVFHEIWNSLFCGKL